MGKKILIVDDEPELPNALRGALELLDYQVQTCESGREVMEALHSYKPDLVVMDVMLPGIDGYSLVSKIMDGDDAAINNLPIIMMSGLETSRCMFERFPRVIAFFTKPFTIDDLVAAVDAELTK